MVRFATLSHDKLCRSLSGELLFYDSHGCVQLLLKGLDLLCNTSLCVCEGEEGKGVSVEVECVGCVKCI